MRDARLRQRAFRVHDRAYALFLLCGSLWLALSVLFLLSLDAPTTGERAFHESRGERAPLETAAARADVIVRSTAPFLFPTVLGLGLLALVSSYHCRPHYPLTCLRLVLYGYPVAFALVAVNVLLPVLFAACSVVCPSILVGISLVWFLILRPGAQRRGTPEMTLGHRGRKVAATALIAAGAFGLAAWPFLWIGHFRHVWMGGHSSSHPMFTIYLGFLPFAALLGTGIVLYPARRWTRGRYAKRPPDVA